jgi:hypothetical protein
MKRQSLGKGLRGRDDGGNVNNVQYKSNRNCHYKSPLYNEYILIEIYFRKTRYIVSTFVNVTMNPPTLYK